MKHFKTATTGLPYTPAEVLDISTPEREQEIAAAVAAAETSGEWTSPYQDAATDLKEMTLTDIYYWVYKCQNPIETCENGQDIDTLIQRDPTVIQLPQGFQKQASLTIGAGGDLLQAPGLTHSKDILYENIADLLFNKDISYANYESPVTRQTLVEEKIGDKAPPIECSSREQFDVLGSYKGQYFTVLNTANNHTYDMGIEGIETTQKTLASYDITNVGTNHSRQESGRGVYLTVNNIKIGFVSATFGLNGHEVPEDEQYRINTAVLLPREGSPDLELLKKQIDDCKQENCDFILATMHWGFEFELFPRNRQIEAAHALVEYGADAIVSHHPHVIQPVEYYQTKRDPLRVAPIAYSLGSLAWGYTAPHIALSLVEELQLVKGEIAGKERTYVAQANITPVFRSAIEQNGETITQLEKLSEHTNGQSQSHDPDYIDELTRLAGLVLGPKANSATFNSNRLHL